MFITFTPVYRLKNLVWQILSARLSFLIACFKSGNLRGEVAKPLFCVHKVTGLNLGNDM